MEFLSGILITVFALNSPLLFAAIVFFITLILSQIVNSDTYEGWASLLGLVLLAMVFNNWHNGVKLADSALLTAIIDQPWYVHFAAVIGFFVAGAFWAKMQWTRLLANQKRQFDEALAKWSKSSKIPVSALYADEVEFSHLGLKSSQAKLVSEVDDSMRSSVKTYSFTTPSTFQQLIEHVTPVPSEHKKSIIGWISCWPISLLNFLVFDFVADAARQIYFGIADNLRKQAVAKMTDGFDLPK
jgi:hypothetical protein